MPVREDSLPCLQLYTFWGSQSAEIVTVLANELRPISPQNKNTKTTQTHPNPELQENKGRLNQPITKILRILFTLYAVLKMLGKADGFLPIFPRPFHAQHQTRFAEVDTAVQNLCTARDLLIEFFSDGVAEMVRNQSVEN